MRFQAWIDCKSSFIYVLTLMKSGNFSGIRFSSVLIKISMNFFDQLVIVIDDPNMEG